MLVEETLVVDLSDDPKNPKIVKLGKYLNKKEKNIFITILKEKQKVLAWYYVDMPGKNSKLVIHNLGMKEDDKPCKQKLRKMHPTITLMVKE